jgi:hypothetical protein
MPVAHQSPAAIIGQLVGMGAETRSPIATNLIAVYKALAGGWEVGEGKPIATEGANLRGLPVPRSKAIRGRDGFTRDFGGGRYENLSGDIS